MPRTTFGCEMKTAGLVEKQRHQRTEEEREGGELSDGRFCLLRCTLIPISDTSPVFDVGWWTSVLVPDCLRLICGQHQLHQTSVVVSYNPQ